MAVILGACSPVGGSTPATPITGPLSGAIHLEGIGDINPRMLIVKDATSDEAAVAAEELGGFVQSSQGPTQHQIWLPVDSLDELDVAKATLEADGFDVDYMVVGRLLLEPGG